MYPEPNENFVEAIEEGRIVKVSESYAQKERLPILRKPSVGQMQKTYSQLPPKTKESDYEKQLEMNLKIRKEMEKPPSWQEKQVLSSLIDNFNWHILKERKRKGLTRKQLARLIGIPENNLRIIEYGRLPSNDFVLIHKIQEALEINLRKGKTEAEKSLDKVIAKIKEDSARATLKEIDPNKKNEKEPLTGNEIEILDD